MRLADYFVACGFSHVSELSGGGFSYKPSGMHYLTSEERKEWLLLLAEDVMLAKEWFFGYLRDSNVLCYLFETERDGPEIILSQHADSPKEVKTRSFAALDYINGIRRRRIHAYAVLLKTLAIESLVELIVWQY